MPPVSQPRLGQLGAHQRRHLIHQLRQGKGFLPGLPLSCFDLAHIQHIIDQIQQMAGRYSHLVQAFVNLLPVLPVFADDLQHAQNAVDGRAHIVAEPVQELRFRPAGRIHRRISLLQPLLFPFFLFMKGRSIFEQNDRPDDLSLLFRFLMIKNITGHEYRLLQPEQFAAVRFFLILHRHLLVPAVKPFQQLVSRIRDPVIFQRLLRHKRAALPAIGIIGTGRRHLQIKRPDRHMIKYIFQTVIGQIHRIHCLRRIHQCIHVVAVFQYRLLQLVIIADQLLFFIHTAACVFMILFHAEDKMMKPPVCGGIVEQHRQPPLMGARPILIHKRDVQPARIFPQMFLQKRQLQLFPQALPVVRGGKLLGDLLHRTGIAAVLRQKEIRACPQYPVLIQQGITVNTV